MRYSSPTLMRFIRHIHLRLARLDWSRPLTRDEIRARIPEFPWYFYVLLPAAKRLTSAWDVLMTILNADVRAEGEFLDEATSRSMHEMEVLAYGGRPAWENDPLVAGKMQLGGSGTDFATR